MLNPHKEGPLPRLNEYSEISVDHLAELKKRMSDSPLNFNRAAMGRWSNEFIVPEPRPSLAEGFFNALRGSMNLGGLAKDMHLMTISDLAIFPREAEPSPQEISYFLGVDPALIGFTKKDFSAPAPQRVTAAQIHAELYAEAVLPEKPEPFLEELPTPSDRAVTLKLMGFSGHPDVKAFHAEEKSYQERKSEAIAAQDRYHWHSELMMKFPTYKFISYEGLYAITDKYQLEIHGVEKFIGEIPDKNVKEMGAFHQQWDGKYFPSYGFRSYLGDQFYIAAPAKEFIQPPKPQFNSVIPRWLLDDPIVLFPAYHGCIIVTAWGDEAADPDVMNERNN